MFLNRQCRKCGEFCMVQHQSIYLFLFLSDFSEACYQDLLLEDRHQEPGLQDRDHRPRPRPEKTESRDQYSSLKSHKPAVTVHGAQLILLTKMSTGTVSQVYCLNIWVATQANSAWPSLWASATITYSFAFLSGADAKTDVQTQAKTRTCFKTKTKTLKTESWDHDSSLENYTTDFSTITSEVTVI